LIEAGVTLLISLIENLPTIIIEIVKAVPKIIAGLIEAFTGSIDKIKEVGGNIIKGLWEGIKAMGDWVKERVSGFFGGIVDGVKGLLGIHSPSRVFAGIGDNMAQGLGEGFEKSMRGVTRDIEGAIPTDFDISTSLKNATSMPSISVNGTNIGTSSSPLNVTIPLTIDGIQLTRVLARLEFNYGQVKLRNLGIA
jgi:phage-related protein